MFSEALTEMTGDPMLCNKKALVPTTLGELEQLYPLRKCPYRDTFVQKTGISFIQERHSKAGSMQRAVLTVGVFGSERVYSSCAPTDTRHGRVEKGGRSSGPGLKRPPECGRKTTSWMQPAHGAAWHSEEVANPQDSC